MSGSRSNLTVSSREASFDTVLEAERMSEKTLRSCRAEANRIRQAASAEERRIAARTDERLQKLHAASHDRIIETGKTLIEAFENERQSLAAAPDPERIADAAMRLAHRLAGIDPP